MYSIAKYNNELSVGDKKKKKKKRLQRAAESEVSTFFLL